MPSFAYQASIICFYSISYFNLQVGWTPVLMAMLIASGGGFVLEMAVEHFKGVTLFGNVDAYCRTRT